MFNPSSHFDKSLLTLKDSAFLNTFKRVDWNVIISDISSKPGSAVTTDPSRWNTDTTEYSEVYKMWGDANFNPNSIKWTNYYPGVDFDNDLIVQIATYLRVNVHRAWISRVDPGFYAPWHWDIDDNENAYLEKGTPIRYSIMISESQPGQIFILGQDYIHGCPRGSIFKWNNYKEWHCGINASMTPKYMLHLLAY
jgi:hypothetical protein